MIGVQTVLHCVLMAAFYHQLYVVCGMSYKLENGQTIDMERSVRRMSMTRMFCSMHLLLGGIFAGNVAAVLFHKHESNKTPLLYNEFVLDALWHYLISATVMVVLQVWLVTRCNRENESDDKSQHNKETETERSAGDEEVAL